MTGKKLELIARAWVMSVDWNLVREKAREAMEEFGEEMGYVQVFIESWSSSNLNLWGRLDLYRETPTVIDLADDCQYVMNHATRLAPRDMCIGVDEEDLCAWVWVDIE